MRYVWHTIWFDPHYGVRVSWRWKWTQGPFYPPRGSQMEQQGQLHSNGPAWTISWLLPKPLSLLHYWQGWAPWKGAEERLIATSRKVRSRKKVGEKNSQTMREACHIISTQENCMKKSFKVKRPKQRSKGRENRLNKNVKKGNVRGMEAKWEKGGSENKEIM